MANKVENVIQHAIRSFRKSVLRTSDQFQRDFNELKTLADDVATKDVNIPKFFLQKSEVNECFGSFFKRKTRPVEYLPIYEDTEVTIGVFILKKGAKLPLHDHPCMYGILRVLQGVLKITSYSVIETDTSSSKVNSSFYYNYPLKVNKHPEVALSDKDSCCVLTPKERNIHEVECVEGPAAFLDILSPPYEDHSSDPRACHYFQEIKAKDENDDCIRLIQIPCPGYWNESVEKAKFS